MKKTFSLIITVYNKEKTIERCINSILKNKTDDYEIIIINDGSQDNSTKIVEKYTKKYDNIHHFYQENKGTGEARLEGVKHSNGSYLIFIDADDTIKPNLLLKLKEKIDELEPDLIKYNLNEINSTKNKERYKTHYETILDGKSTLSKFSNTNIRYCLFPMYAIKKELLTSILPDYYNIEFYEDIANIPKIIYKAKKVLCINFDGYNYYRNNDSLSKTIREEEKLNYFKLAHEELLTYFKNNLGVNDKLYIEIKNYYDYHLKRKTKELKN